MSKAEVNEVSDGKSKVETATGRSVAIAVKGIKTSADFAAYQSALIGDIMEGTVSVSVANSASKACQNLLENVRMQFKYGSAKKPNMNLQLVD